MQRYLQPGHYDLVTPDGAITEIKSVSENVLEVVVKIEKISSVFLGFKLPAELIFFNLKSTLAQLGVNGIGEEYVLDEKLQVAHVKVKLVAYGNLALEMLKWLRVGSYIGKLFAADESRRVRNPDYLRRMFERSDRKGRPLLSLGGAQGMDDLILEKIDGRTVAFIPLLDGVVKYEESAQGFIPTLARALMHPEVHTRALLQLDQTWYPQMRKVVTPEEILLVRTWPLHIRTVFANVVDKLLPKGYTHTSASVLEPTTAASGDVYELYGSSEYEINDIPLEFYTLEPYREHVFFADRDQLHEALSNPEEIFKVFETSPAPENHLAAVFVVKGSQLQSLTPQDWISREPRINEFPGLIDPDRQTLMVERYIAKQPAYPFLKAIEDELITSQGVLFMRYFPTPLLKRMLLSHMVQRCLKGIYFQYPSLLYGDFFSHEDRSLLQDLSQFGIAVYWADKTSGHLLRYTPKPHKDTGMFVALDRVDLFEKMTAFGIYGSNLLAPNLEAELTKLVEGLSEMRYEIQHALFNKDTPLGLVTEGGPAVMELGNRIAKSLRILSCARLVDFRSDKDAQAVSDEQKANFYIDAKMTYRLDRLVERQAEFNLDFPIFLMGGIGTDFEYCLEELRRKVGSSPPTPILLFGEIDYWREKITSRFKSNLLRGTIVGSEWVSNCSFCVQNAKQALQVYRNFFSGALKLGKSGPVYQEGFIIV